jgi:hypothetical protein
MITAWPSHFAALLTRLRAGEGIVIETIPGHWP